MKQIFFALFAFLVSCVTYPSITSPPSATTSSPRTLILGGLPISEEAAGGFVSWTCQDYLYPEGIVVEVGFVDDPIMEALGFILFDGGKSGETAVYKHEGLDRSWFWGDKAEYKFVIKTDGSGLYYDFSNVPAGESTKPNAIYKCKQR